MFVLCKCGLYLTPALKKTFSSDLLTLAHIYISLILSLVCGDKSENINVISERLSIKYRKNLLKALQKIKF